MERGGAVAEAVARARGTRFVGALPSSTIASAALQSTQYMHSGLHIPPGSTPNTRYQDLVRLISPRRRPQRLFDSGLHTSPQVTPHPHQGARPMSHVGLGPRSLVLELVLCFHARLPWTELRCPPPSAPPCSMPMDCTPPPPGCASMLEPHARDSGLVGTHPGHFARDGGTWAGIGQAWRV